MTEWDHIHQRLPFKFRQPFHFVESHLTFGVPSNYVQQIRAFDSLEVEAGNSYILDVFCYYDLQLLFVIGVKEPNWAIARADCDEVFQRRNWIWYTLSNFHVTVEAVGYLVK